MQRSPTSRLRPYEPASPVDSLGAHLRWQVFFALTGIVLLASLLGYSSYNVTNVLVPARGGVFREGVAGTPRYLNPLLCDGSEVDQDLCALLYRGLTKIDKQGRVVPDLALDWTIENGTSYTFRMREDQFWHDGQRVTADDVLFTVGILQDPSVLGLPGLTLLWRAVTVEKLGDFSVRFTLPEPYTPFLDYTAIGLLPQHVYGGIPAAELASGPISGTPIGAGPMAVERIAADHIRLVPHPFSSESSPYLSALEFHFYPNHSSLFSAFVTDEIDGISTILPADMPIVASRPDLQLFSTEQAGYAIITFNLDNPNAPFFQDKLVRQALYYGLDRQQMMEDVLAGQGIVAHSILLPENWAYNPNVRQYTYDPEEARRLLDEAGWIDSNGDGIRDKEGVPFEFLLYAGDEAIQSALIERISQDWQKIGVRAVPTPVSFAGLLSDFLVPRKFSAALLNWKTPGDPDPYQLWHSTRAEGGGQNYAVWRNEQADEIMEQARTIINESERRRLYWQFQDLFADELPGLILYYPVYTYGVSQRVHNVQIGSLNSPSERFTDFAEWYIVTRRVPANQVPTAVPPTPPSRLPQPSQPANGLGQQP